MRPKTCLLLVLSFLAATGLGAACAVPTFDALVEPYPPLTWQDAEFTGTVISLQAAKPGVKAKWALVQTDEGAQVRMPMDVHDQIPRPDARVQKVAGQVEFDFRYPSDQLGQWQGPIRPCAEPGEGFLLGLGLWAVWSAALFGIVTALGWALRRVPPAENVRTAGD